MTKAELIEQTAKSELMQFLGVEIKEASPERVILTMEVTPKVHQYIGIMNGGVSLYLCETAASVGTVAGVDLTKFAPVGIEINANHLRAVSKGAITVEARAIYPGRTLNVWQIDITNDKGKLVCTGRCTVLIQKKPAVQPFVDNDLPS
jgi:1,4-dihydroxy-2-naphthoyl-CoA hydrolase